MKYRAPRTSELIAALPDAFSTETISFGEIVTALRSRVFGLGILIFSLPNVLPMPPGIPAACGAILMLLGLQLALGKDSLWLPQFLARRTIPHSALVNIVTRSMPWIHRFERLSRPRMDALAGPTGARCIGAMVFVLGLVLLLPFPFLGNMPPGAASTVLGLALVERDGVMVMVGYALSLIALGVTGLTTWLIFEGAMWFF